MKPHQMKLSRSLKAEFDLPDFEEVGPEQEEIGLIQGRKPGSVQEWRVAKAIIRLGLDFRFQYPINGGNVPGGYFIDFLVMMPYVQPLEVQSLHWHTGRFANDEAVRSAIIESIWGREIRYVYQEQLGDDDSAYAAVKKALYGPAEKPRY